MEKTVKKVRPVIRIHEPKPPALMTKKEKFKRNEQLRYKLIQPFRKRNAIVGLGIFGFIIGIYIYSIMSVKQEKFLDSDFDKKE